MYLHRIAGPLLERVTLRLDQSVRSALIAMNESAIRFVLVTTSETGEFVGVLADGDVRRFLTDGGDLNVALDQLVNRDCVFVDHPLSTSEALSKLEKSGIEYLPLVQDGEVSALYALLARRPAGELSAVIMAGGLGSRLRPLTNDLPKPLLELGGVPVLEHIMSRLAKFGVTDFTLCVNYLGEMIEERFGDGSSLGLKIRYVYEDRRLGTGGALSLIKHALTEPFLLMNGDLITDFDPTEAVELHRARQWSATMVVRNHSIQVPYGVVRVADDGEYLEADEKPTLRLSINAGIYVLSTEVLKHIPYNTFYDLPELFELLGAHGHKVGTLRHRGECIDIGSMEEWERAQRSFATDA